MSRLIADITSKDMSLRRAWEEMKRLLNDLLNRNLNGAGSPEGMIEAPVGTLYTRTDGGPGTTLYVKESGIGDTGWVAK